MKYRTVAILVKYL